MKESEMTHNERLVLVSAIHKPQCKSHFETE